MVDRPDGAVEPRLFGAYCQLEALLRFLEDGDYPDVRELRELQSALSEVAHGRHVTWLEPKPDSNGSRLSQETAILHGSYAAIMDGLIVHGDMSERAAAEFVIEHSGDLRRTIKKRSNGAAAWGAVKHWRDRAGGGFDRARADEQDGFRAMKERIKLCLDAGATIKPTAIFLLKGLGDYRGAEQSI
jgi:hypothetical protein